MRYEFLVDTYRTERLKVLSTWSLFADADLGFRCGENPRSRSVLEQMVHQCVSENLWFCRFFGIDLDTPPLPEVETRLEFIQRYATDSERRLEALEDKTSAWWEEDVAFFETERRRAWVMVRRIAHTSHHRGQQTAMLRMLERTVYSTYGPTADTGGLMKDSAPTIYPYASEATLLGDSDGVDKAELPVPGGQPVTEKPDAESP